MKTVYDKEGRELAVVLRAVDYIQQTDKRFFSEPEDTLQIGSLFFPQDSGVAPHAHKPKDIPHNPMEILLVVGGDAWADIYDETRQLAESIELLTGDILIQKRGGHGVHFPCGTTLLEIKCGPYHGKDSDKEMINDSNTR